MLTHEKRDLLVHLLVAKKLNCVELAFSVLWFGYSKLRGFALAHVTYCTSQLNTINFKRNCRLQLQYLV